jgi:hypothetical protein
VFVSMLHSVYVEVELYTYADMYIYVCYSVLF